MAVNCAIGFLGKGPVPHAIHGGFGMAVEMALLEVHRELGGTADHLRAYQVVVDGRVVGSLHPDESAAFEVPSGFHEL
jgi:hypothetical protein